MQLERIFNQLNEQLKELEKAKLLPKITLEVGEVLQKLTEFCSDCCPYSKVAVLYTKNSYLCFNTELTKNLKSKNLSPINFIFDENEITSYEKEQVIKSIPETVRIILTVDNTLIELCQALAKELKLACAVGVCSLPSHTLFSRHLPSNLAIAFNEQLSVDESRCYSAIVSKIISLLDIKLKQFFKILPKNNKLTDEFIEILDLALDVLNQEKQERKQKLLQYLLRLDFLERAFGHYDTYKQVKISLCLVKLLAVNLNKEFYSVPNYLLRASAVNNIYNQDYFKTLLNFKYQLQVIKSFEENLLDVKKGLSALAKIYADKAQVILTTFSALGGKEKLTSKEILENVKYMGDMPNGINCLTLLRENGGLEY